MVQIKKIDTTDTLNTGRLKINEAIDALVNSTGNTVNIGFTDSFDNLADLKTKYPSGATGMFFVFNNGSGDGGHSYIWENNAWKDLGVYQATNLSDGSVTYPKIAKDAVTPIKASFFEKRISLNLFDKTDVKNGYINTSGVFVASTDYICEANLKSIDPSTQYTTQILGGASNGTQVAFYTINGVYISTSELTNGGTITTPSNSYYRVISVFKNRADNFTFAKGATAVTNTEFYEDYLMPDEYIKSLKDGLDSETIKNNAVTPAKTSFFERLKSDNLFDPSAIRNGYISTTGVFTSSDDYRCENEMKTIEPDTPYTPRIVGGASNGTQIAYYDKDSNYISSVELNHGVTVTTPNNAAYRIISVFANRVNGFSFAKGTTVVEDTTFYDYWKIKDEYNGGDIQPIVAADGTGSFTLIQEACNFFPDGTTINIRAGIYDEIVDIKDRNLILIGSGAKETIVRTTNDQRDTPPLEISKGFVKGIGFYAEKPAGATNPTDYSPPYAAHIDYDQSANSRLIFEDCWFRSDWNAGVGIGLRKGFDLSFRNCDFETGNNSMGGVFFHESTTAALYGDQSITFDSCNIRGDGNTALRVQSLGDNTNKVNVRFIRSLIFSVNNLATNASIQTEIATTGSAWLGTNNFYLTPDSFGNNNARLNY